MFLLKTLPLQYISLLGLVFVAYRIIFRSFLWPRYFSPLRHVPTAPGANPIVGHMHLMVSDDSPPLVGKFVRLLGPVVRVFGAFGLEGLVFVKEEQLRQILEKDWLEYPKPTFIQHILGIVAGYGLLTVEGNEHRMMRKTLNPAFSLTSLMSPSEVEVYHDSIYSLVKIFKDELESLSDPSEGKVIPVYHWFSKAVLDIISDTAFGYKVDSLNNSRNELAEAHHKLSSITNGSTLAKLVVLFHIPGMPKLLASSQLYRYRNWLTWMRFPDNLRVLVESLHTIRSISAKIVQQKIKDNAEVSERDGKHDIMSILVRARNASLEGNETAYSMSEQAMVEHVLTFLGAGSETTACGLAVVLWSLANDQESQRRLREEVAPVLKRNPHPDYRTLNQFRWLDCVIMESLRVYPPIPHIVRIANKTHFIGDLLVPKGTFIHIPIRAINTYREIWGADAEEFKPSRWLDLPKEYNPKYSLSTFLAGPHACTGKTMAMMMMKAIVATLIANFSFEPAREGQVPEFKTGIVMKPSDGLPLLVRSV